MGIPLAFSKYLGDQRDWAVLSANVGAVSQHPVEKFVSLLSPFSAEVVADPTDLLRARAALDEGTASLWIPRSKSRLGIYEPTLNGQSVSLLWGEHLAFRRRCSRGIISVSKTLLTFRPTIEAGFDGRAICLAHGILARNKGLEPWALVCNLGLKNTFTAFEENSVLWPRPANKKDTERSDMLKAHYESSYVPMIISLNNMNPRMKSPPSKARNLISRPDIICVGLLLKAWGRPEPSWWNQDGVSQRRRNQIQFLSRESEWKKPMTRLLGLDEWPVGFEEQPSIWGDVVLPNASQHAAP